MWRELTPSPQVPPFVYTELVLTNREVYPGVGVVPTQNPRLGFAWLKVSADNTILSQQAEKKNAMGLPSSEFEGIFLVSGCKGQENNKLWLV